ncbi:MAG: hypothetical protein IKN55_07570 [Oscillospiraceae bacterium]|nr:hypothetical protein [Oscillospiraceae bacterium]
MDETRETAAVPEQEAAPKLKIICRLQEGRYSEQLVAEVPDGADDAMALLHAFSPESLTRNLTEACGDGSVVVFRTDTRQMEEFRALLDAHAVSGV